MYAPSQWEATLHCNVDSQWLAAYTEWSLWMMYCPACYCTRSKPNWTPDPQPKLGKAGFKPEFWCLVTPKTVFQLKMEVTRPDSEIHSQSYHFGLICGMSWHGAWERMIYSTCSANNTCHPSVAKDGADIWPRNASQIYTCHLFTSQFCLYLHFGSRPGRQIHWAKLPKHCSSESCQLSGKVVIGLDCTVSKTKATVKPLV